MARITIKDLPKNQKISREEMRKIHGGWSLFSWLIDDGEDAPEIKFSAREMDNWPKFK